MFVPCEGIGAAIAKVAVECGLKPLKMEFFEDRAVVEFSSFSPLSRHEKAGKPPEPDDMSRNPAYPDGPWTKAGRVKGSNVRLWACEGREATLAEIAKAYGVAPSCMEYRLRATGFATTKSRKSRFERGGKRRRMSLSDK